MEELTLVSATSDPTLLYRIYQDLSRAFDASDAQLDILDDRLRRLDDDETERRHELTAELDELRIGRTVLLGWVSAYFAAYSFALHGSETELMTTAARAATAFLDTSGNAIPASVPDALPHRSTP